MPLGRGLSGSEIKYISAVSPVAIAAAGSSGPSNLGDYGFGTLIVAADSADLTVNLERSTASDGTFGQFGVSLTSVASGIAVRSFKMGSPNWLRVSYDNTNNGSIIPSVVLAMSEPRVTPVRTQDDQTTVFSTVI